jgi:hypothetical protein
MGSKVGTNMNPGKVSKFRTSRLKGRTILLVFEERKIGQAEEAASLWHGQEIFRLKPKTPLNRQAETFSPLPL